MRGVRASVGRQWDKETVIDMGQDYSGETLPWGHSLFPQGGRLKLWILSLWKFREKSFSLVSIP